MKNFRRTIYPIFAMLVVALLSLVSVTYAWFTKGNVASVNDLTLDVESSDGLLISLDGETWVSNLTGITFNGELTPLSTVGAMKTTGTGGIDIFSADYEDGLLKNIVEATKCTQSTDKGYYAMNLYFQNSSDKAMNVSLEGTGQESVATQVYDTISNGRKYTRYSSLAARIGFLYRGSVLYTSAVSSITEMATQPNTGNQSFTIFEPNATTHTLYANNYLTTQNQKESYYGLKKANTTTSLDPSVTTGANAEYFGAVTTKDTLTDTFFTIPAMSTICVTVYFWIEGQDVDCTNFVAGRQIFADLKFIGTKVA